MTDHLTRCIALLAFTAAMVNIPAPDIFDIFATLMALAWAIACFIAHVWEVWRGP